jgi:hypothetical protein
MPAIIFDEPVDIRCFVDRDMKAERIAKIDQAIVETAKIILKEMEYSEDLRNYSLLLAMTNHLQKLDNIKKEMI